MVKRRKIMQIKHKFKSKNSLYTKYSMSYLNNSLHTK